MLTPIDSDYGLGFGLERAVWRSPVREPAEGTMLTVIRAMADAGAESHHDFGRNVIPAMVARGRFTSCSGAVNLCKPIFKRRKLC